MTQLSNSVNVNEQATADIIFTLTFYTCFCFVSHILNFSVYVLVAFLHTGGATWTFSKVWCYL